MEGKVFERSYKNKKDDYKKFANMLKKYDMVGYVLTVIYSIGLLSSAILSYIYIGLEINGLKTVFLIQALIGLYLLYNWTTGYKTSARAMLNLFLRGKETVDTRFCEEYVEVIYDTNSVKTINYNSINNIRRGDDFFILSFGMDYVFANYDGDNEKDQDFIMFMGQLENEYCKKKINKLALKTLIGMIIFGVIILTEFILLILF